MSTTTAVAIQQHRRYAVVSPQWLEDVGDYSTAINPSETVCAYVEVEAKNRRQAKSKAVGTREFRDWVDMQRGDGKSPFTGLKVYPVDETGDEILP